MLEVRRIILVLLLDRPEPKGLREGHDRELAGTSVIQRNESLNAVSKVARKTSRRARKHSSPVTSSSGDLPPSPTWGEVGLGLLAGWRLEAAFEATLCWQAHVARQVGRGGVAAIPELRDLPPQALSRQARVGWAASAGCCACGGGELARGHPR